MYRELVVSVGVLLIAAICDASFPAQLESRRDYISHTLDNMLGVTALQNGNYDKALRRYDSILDGSSASPRLGYILQKKAVVADIYVHKAIAYSKKGLYHYALKFYDQAMSIKEDVVGAQSYAVGAIFNNIAGVYADRASRETVVNADREEALRYYTKALNIFLREPSDRRAQAAASTSLQVQRNLTLANTYHNMGKVFQEMGRYHESVYHYGRAIYLQNNTETVGPWSHGLAETYYNLGVCHDQQEEWVKGLDAYVMAAKIDLSIGGIDTENLEPVTYGLGLFRHNQGRVPLAVNGLIKTLNRKLYVLGPSHISTAVTHMFMGGAFEELANYTEAMKFYQKSHDALVGHLSIEHHRGERHAFDNAHILVMDIYNKMGLCEERHELLNKAQTYFTYAVNMTSGIHTSEDSSHWNRSAASRAHILGRTYTGADAYDTAAQSMYAANVYSTRAHVYFQQGQYQNAMDDCDLSTSIRVDEFETGQCGAPCESHPGVGWNYYLKARADRALNNGNGVAALNNGCDADTETTFQKAMDIYSEVLGPRHLQTQAIRLQLDSCPSA